MLNVNWEPHLPPTPPSALSIELTSVQSPNLPNLGLDCLIWTITWNIPHWTTSYLIGTCLDQRTRVQSTFARHTVNYTGVRWVLTVPFQNCTLGSWRPQPHGYGTLDGIYTGVTGWLRRYKTPQQNHFSSMNSEENYVSYNTSIQQCPGWLHEPDKGVVWQALRCRLCRVSNLLCEVRLCPFLPRRSALQQQRSLK